MPKLIYKAGVLLILLTTSGTVLSAFSPDAFIVRITNFSERIYSQKKTRFRIQTGSTPFSFPDTVNQRAITSDTRGTVLETGTFKNTKLKDKNKYLRSSIFLNLSSTTAKNITNTFNNKSSAIDQVEKYVHSHINNKTTGIPLITASQVYKTKSGDCTEHSVLAIALLRSMGIPSRAVVGMLLSKEFQGINNVFVYHMWAEAYVNGKWVLVDATRPGQKYYNRYIAFTYHSLESMMPLPYLRALSALQSIHVTYVK